MAESTKGTRRQNNVIGFRRVVTWDAVTFANGNGDTLTVPGIKRIEMIDFLPTTNSSFGFTISGNVATLVAAAATPLTGLTQVTGI